MYVLRAIQHLQVACGSFHTAAVMDGILYVAGRDRVVCMSDHALTFARMRFDKDSDDAPNIVAEETGPCSQKGSSSDNPPAFS